MLDTSNEVIENDIILKKKVGCNRIDKGQSLGATGSKMTGYEWKNRPRSDRLPVE